jgi:hypothetical protein
VRYSLHGLKKGPWISRGASGEGSKGAAKVGGKCSARPFPPSSTCSPPPPPPSIGTAYSELDGRLLVALVELRSRLVSLSESHLLVGKVLSESSPQGGPTVLARPRGKSGHASSPRLSRVSLSPANATPDASPSAEPFNGSNSGAGPSNSRPTATTAAAAHPAGSPQHFVALVSGARGAAVDPVLSVLEGRMYGLHVQAFEV